MMVCRLVVCVCFCALLVCGPGCSASDSPGHEEHFGILWRSAFNRYATGAPYRLRFSLERQGETSRTLQASRASRKRASQRVCSWNEATSACELSSARKGASSDAPNAAFSSLVAHFAACERARSKKSCNSAGDCVWDALEGRCYFVDFRIGQESSPCLEAAPAAVNIPISTGLCPTLSKKACAQDSHCYWVDSTEVCSSGGIFLFYGFSVPEYSEAAGIMFEAWFGEFFSTFDSTSPNFDWSSVLRWDGPFASCPDSIRPEICLYLDRGMRPLIPNRLYCFLKYEEAYQKTDCQRDPYCHFDEGSDTCAIGENIDAGTAVIQSNIESVENKLDRKIYSSLSSCAIILEKKKCKGKCGWIEAHDECRLRWTKMFAMVASADKRGDDALCKFYEAAADSDCLEIQNEYECKAATDCTWRTLDGVCFPSADYLTRVAAEDL